MLWKLRRVVFSVVLIVVVSIFALAPPLYAIAVILEPGPLHLKGPDNNVVHYHINIVENHKYRVQYTMPVLRCFDGSCDQIVVEWMASDNSYVGYWGSISGDDRYYNAGSVYTDYLQANITPEFFANSNNGAVDITISGFCSEENGDWADCYIPDFQIADLDAESPPPPEPPPPSPPPPTPPPPTNSAATPPAARAIIADKIDPKIRLDSKPPHIVQNFPVLRGTASDNTAVARIDYSTDGGLNWLPVDKATGLGTDQVKFSFQPTNLEDGNYRLVVQATDFSGNTATTKVFDMVVDRLSPDSSSFVVNIGPEVLKPNNLGAFQSLTGVSQKVTLNAIGGPVSVYLRAVPIDQKALSRNFVLTQASTTGLWSGNLTFNQPGNYSLSVKLLDGAGNKTSRSLGTMSAVAPAKLVQQDNHQAISGASLKIYFYEPEAADWVLWDGASYGQNNPQLTDKDGNFRYFLPSGKYYLKAAAKGYKTFTSDIFELSSPTPLASNLTMTPANRWLRWLNWSNLSTGELKLNSSSRQSAASNKLINHVVPMLSLTSTSGSKVNSVDWLGRPTLLSFNNTWSPTTSEYLATLAKLQQNPDINIVPIGMEESANKLKAYTDIAGLKLQWLADPDGTLIKSFGMQNITANYFINRKGVIKQLVYGQLSPAEVEYDLSNL